MQNVKELLARISHEPVTNREKSLAFVSLVKEIYNHPRLKALQGKAEGNERWCELKDLKWKKFKNLSSLFELSHITSLKVGCKASDAGYAATLKLQFEFRETKDTPSRYLPIPAREIHELRIDNAGECSSHVRIWYYEVDGPNPHSEINCPNYIDEDYDHFLLLARFAKKALDGKFGGKILPVDLTQQAK